MQGSTISQHQFQQAINQSVLYLVYIFIGKWVLGYISMLCIRISSIRISSALRLAYIRALFSQPIASIDKVSPGKVSSRITTSANTIQVGISQQFSLLIQAITFTIGAYVVAFVKSALLTLVASACLPFILFAYGSILPFYIKIHKKTEDLLEESSSLSFEIFSSIRIVVAFGAEGRLHTRYKNILDNAARNEKKAGLLIGTLMCPMFFSIYATFGLTFWFGIHQFSRGHIVDPGTITMYVKTKAVCSRGMLTSMYAVSCFLSLWQSRKSVKSGGQLWP
jgi:ABC-type multidrug transport system fused ATPase/permease subunit